MRIVGWRSRGVLFSRSEVYFGRGGMGWGLGFGCLWEWGR